MHIYVHILTNSQKYTSNFPRQNNSGKTALLFSSTPSLGKRPKIHMNLRLQALQMEWDQDRF